MEDLNFRYKQLLYDESAADAVSKKIVEYYQNLVSILTKVDPNKNEH